jgi:hypothetical protein
MQSRFLACSLLLLGPINCTILAPEGGTVSGPSQAPAPASEAYVQVTSVTVEPSVIHKAQNPNAATIIAQILLRGLAPLTQRPRSKSGLVHLIPQTMN